MKYPFYFLLMLIVGCQNHSTNQPDADTPVEIVVAEPVPQTKSPVPYATDSPSLLHDLLRSTLREELGFTLPEEDGEKEVKNSYSFEIRENNGRPTWVVKEKWYDTATNKLNGGAEYLMLWDVVGKNSIEIVNSSDGKKTGLRIKPREGNTFVFHPYSNDPDVAVNEVIIGWYDHSQDVALLRAYTYMKQLADNMEKWEK